MARLIERTNRIDRKLAVALWGAVFVVTLGWVVNTGTSASIELSSRQAPQASAKDLAAQFENTALDSTRDISINGPRAIDSYWEAVGHAGWTAPTEELYTFFGRLYRRLQGDHILRISLTEAGWKYDNPAQPLILTEGQTAELLVVLRNETRQARKLSILTKGSSVTSEPDIVSLPAEGTAGEWVHLDPKLAGPLQAALEVEAEGQQILIPMTGEVRSPGKLLVRILGSNSEVTPARVYLTGSDGMRHTPAGVLDRVMWMSGDHFFYSSGVFEVVLPAGWATVEAVKGFDNFPAEAKAEILPGRTTSLELHFHPVEGMDGRGWYCGDGHVHGNYEQDQSATPQDDLLVARAEGLNIASMMVSNGAGSRVFDEQYFEGKPNAVSLPDCILYWNEEMRTSGFYGHLVLGNLKKLVEPIYTGFPGTAHWEDYPSNYQQARQAKTEGGYTAYAHPAVSFEKFPWGSSAGEAVVDVPLGVIDAIEVFCSQEETSASLWYRFLNLGFKVGIVAGSDAESLNYRYSFIMGGDRLYVYTGKNFSYSRWIEGLQHGRVFATQGPLLFFDIDGKEPGYEFRLDRGPADLPATARASSYIPITKLEIVMNGEVTAEVSSKVPTSHLEWKGTLHLEKSAWVAARVWGPGNRLIANGPSRWAERRSPWVLLAHTGPFYVKVGNSTVCSAADRDYMLRWIEALTKRVQNEARFANEAHRNEILAACRRARQIYIELPGTASDPGAARVRW
jgi:hypothetical protein